MNPSKNNREELEHLGLSDKGLALALAYQSFKNNREELEHLALSEDAFSVGDLAELYWKARRDEKVAGPIRQLAKTLGYDFVGELFRHHSSYLVKDDEEVLEMHGTPEDAPSVTLLGQGFRVHWKDES